MLRTISIEPLSMIARCISLALLHILFFATMAMFLYPRSDVQKFTQFEKFQRIFFFRRNQKIKAVPILLTFMMLFINCWFFLLLPIIQMWWCPVLTKNRFNWRLFHLVSLAYSQNRLNVLFFIAFVFIGNM